MSHFDPTVLVLASLATGLGAAIQGAVGFGMALIAAPLLVLLDPRLVPGPIQLATFVFSLLTSRRELMHIHGRGVTIALVGRIPGIVLGAYVLAKLSDEALSRCFAVIVLLAVLITLLGTRWRPTTPALLGAGFLSGVMGTVSSIGGPPIALVYADEEGPRLRSTLALYFMIGSALSLVALVLVGRFGSAEVQATLWLLPGTFAGYVISSRLRHVLDRGYTRTAVLVVSAVSACLVLL
jgi:uncharacterized membrane protein YfcA